MKRRIISWSPTLRSAAGSVAAVLFAAACTRLAAPDATLGKTSEKLVAESERLTGADLPAKHLILTFDDAPVSMDVTGSLSTYLSTRPTPISATFFIDGSCVAATTLDRPICDTPTSDGFAVLAKLANDGHLVGNHTTTARDLTSIPLADVTRELTETDTIIAPYVKWNRKVFRAPNGAWIGNGADGGNVDAIYDALRTTPLDAYAGPIFWNIGGGPTTATQASDTDCWTLGYTTKQCGDLYLQEIHARSSGIVLFHDSLPTLGLIRYLVPLLEADGYTFDTLDASPALTALLPACDSTCATCNGPGVTSCLTCAPGQRILAGACTTCLVCPAGTFTTGVCNAAADTTCSSCPDGTFNADAGSIGCTVCASCDDGNACTLDQCSATQGCTHTKVADCPLPDAAPPPVVDASPPRESGPVIDNEANVAADTSDDGSGCRTSRGRGAANGGLVVLFLLVVSVRRRRGTLP